MHRLHPFTLLISFCLVTAAVMTATFPVVPGGMAAVYLLLLASNRRGTLPLRFLGTALLLSLPVTAAVFIGSYALETESLAAGIEQGLPPFTLFALRLVALVAANLLLVSLMDERRLIGALRAAGFPAGPVFLVAAVVRFIPQSFSELGRIVNAQRVRGLSPVRLLLPTGFLPLALPLLHVMIRRSLDFSLSVELHGIPGHGRASSGDFGWRDGSCLVLHTALAAAVFLLPV